MENMVIATSAKEEIYAEDWKKKIKNTKCKYGVSLNI